MMHLVPLILTKKAIWDVGICNTHFLGAKKVSMSSVHKELWVILLIGINKGNLNPIHIGQDSKVNVQSLTQQYVW
jgi:hypothetical protein